MKIQNILIVCIANICRSPMAEYLFKDIFTDLQIASAGISGLIGHHADDKAINSMQLKKIDISQHTAQKLNTNLIKHADLILVMNLNQKNYIEQRWPFSKGKIFRLGHWRECDVPDPYKHNQHVFNETCNLISNCIDDWKKIFNKKKYKL